MIIEDRTLLALKNHIGTRNPQRLVSGLSISKLVIVLMSWQMLACTSSLVVDADFPKPVAKPIDISMGVVYDPQMTRYVYEEKSDTRARWQIDVGEAHEKLFRVVFEPLFSTSQPLESLDEAGQQLDLILLPKISEFQYSSPRETQLKIYEVWIKYNMQVYNPDGQLIADWIMSAYGKTPTAFLQSNEEAMNQAIVVALRDLGASLTTGFHKVPEIKSWLEQRATTAAASQSPADPSGG
jgi:hypothetical protein